MKIYKISSKFYTQADNAKIYSNVDQQKIVEEFLDGRYLKYIQVDYGIKHSTLRNIILSHIGEERYREILREQKRERERDKMIAGKFVSEEEQKEIVNEFLSGEYLTDIGAKHDLHSQKMKTIIESHIGEKQYKAISSQQKLERDQKLKKDLPPQNVINEIVDKFFNGMAIKQLAKEHKTNMAYISNVIKSQISEEQYKKVQEDNRIKAKTVEPDQEEKVLSMFVKEDKSIEQISNKMRITFGNIRSFLVDKLGPKRYNEIKEEQGVRRRQRTQPVYNLDQDRKKKMQDLKKLNGYLFDKVRKAYREDKLSIEDIANTFNVDIMVLDKFLRDNENNPFFK
jgi:hypothetical protein